MKISKQAQRQTRRLFRSCLADGLLDHDRVRRVLGILSHAKPRGWLQVLARLHRLVKLDMDRHAARVESATPLDGDLRAAMVGQIRQRYGRGIEPSFQENPALIGGLRVQVGSDLFDGSVKTKLERLASTF
ncbi:MAG: F0F1 ATP synthase subunit delta [Verrucomicrobia bacterium]|nr:F0F1 ATP synthase subunit delta [Verrucomicrobiota bacterium]MDE3098048.1 F0F1 ATP synthase subunit delta [Verrucomicrobiota bacterium]